MKSDGMKSTARTGARGSSHIIFVLRACLIEQAPRKNGQLKTQGLYALVRHPMYAGLILAGLGVCLIASSAARWFCFGLLVFVIERKMSFEVTRKERVVASLIPRSHFFKIIFSFSCFFFVFFARGTGGRAQGEVWSRVYEVCRESARAHLSQPQQP